MPHEVWHAYRHRSVDGDGKGLEMDGIRGEWVFRWSNYLVAPRVAAFLPESPVTGCLRPHSANLHPFIIDIQPPLLNWLSCLPLTLICFRSFNKTMLSQRILARRLPQVAARAIAPRAAFSQAPALRAAEVEDPFQNNNYPNPPRVKRAFRDPYGGWWDAQEKRNFGEPVHEDNEILGVFSPEQYTHVSAGKGFFHLGCFVVAFLGVCGVVSMYYPDKPSVPKTYADGLEKELGGPNALPARKSGEDKW